MSKSPNQCEGNPISPMEGAAPATIGQAKLNNLTYSP